MGTRCLTRIVDNDGELPLTCLYRQFDGYPSGHGQELLDILKGTRFVNGIPCSGEDAEKQKMANGMGDLAAQLIVGLKNKHKVGNVYVYPPAATDCMEEYVYTLYPSKDTMILMLRVNSVWHDKTMNRILYEGPLDEFNPKKTEEADNEV